METDVKRIYAGVDAGGTKTRLVWKQAGGDASGEERFGPMNVNSIGEIAFGERMDLLCGRLRKLGDCEGICLGVAGITNPASRRMIERSLDRFGIGNRIVTSDWEISLYGALEGAPGLLVIAGTGSVCCGRNAAGDVIRTGGWGHLIGDEGSGYALGRDALRAAAAMIDGTGPRTGIVPLLKERHGLDDRSAIIRYVYGNDKSAVAALSGIVLEAAEEGDAAAEGILRENAEALAVQAEAAARTLSIEKLRIALAGGLLAADTIYGEKVREAMGRRLPGSRCVLPARDAADGALLMAQRAFGDA